MDQTDFIFMGGIALACFGAVCLGVIGGWPGLQRVWLREEGRLDTVLNKELLLGVSVRMTVLMCGVLVLLLGLVMGMMVGHVLGFVAGVLVGMAGPYVAVGRLDRARRKRLNEQILDAVTSLASGLRAGLNLVQSMELLVKNTEGPVEQEFSQLLREYGLGVDLKRAMRNTSDRIGSSYYRLLFTAVQAHRERGGDLAISLDKIGESIREIQRLEGRLDALTAQGRSEARFMGVMPFVIVGILWMISPGDTAKLWTEPLGRLISLFAAVMIGGGFLWIRRIMRVDL